MMIRIRNLMVAFVMVGAVAACGSSSSGGTTSSGGTSGSGSGSSSSGNTVTIKDFKFNPPTLTVKSGTKVTFTNEDGTAHTATSTGSSTINSGTLNKGQSYTVTFTKPGTYSYICNFHNFMHGSVTVR